MTEKSPPKIQVLFRDVIEDTLSLTIRFNYPKGVSVEKVFNWPVIGNKAEIDMSLRRLWEQYRPDKMKMNPLDIEDITWEDK